MNEIVFYDPVTKFDMYLRIAIGVAVIIVIILMIIDNQVRKYREKKFKEDVDKSLYNNLNNSKKGSTDNVKEE